MNVFAQRFWGIIREVIPSTTKTAFWIIRLTVGVSFVVMLLKYSGILAVVSQWLTPVFGFMGLPGEAALAWLTGYFVNVYSAIAVFSGLSLSVRQVTILSVMVLCAHNMITETAVQHKTGSSFVRIWFIRTFVAFLLGLVMNRLLPGRVAVSSLSDPVAVREAFGPVLSAWALSTLRLVVKMILIIYGLSVMNRVLSVYGVLQRIARFLKPVLGVFGLPENTGFLWIVANFLGLAYGSAVMMEERNENRVSREEADLLNHHICIAHSNLEDVILLGACGAHVIWLLFSRWVFAVVLVWERRLEYGIRRSKRKG